ncbi:hypothetical protein A5773_12995 [Mycobacterium sp. 852014-52450_SCH5900713]|uniref:hypothetical protein n=1 Tax=Mycobacterium sp. 852014-52450_SCH5900713 TaxID=1834116 RepID=UPI0007FDD7E9|nr:hypothetical protein [Mycobacterium sp. 852014-52450_SCH5900713]OBF96338.1 hypothetical protein A5773_12995 [Mycobacterium sp. 852014-52450_SCH5900713]
MSPARRLADGRDGVVYSSRSEWGYYNNGHEVRVVLPNDPYTGRVGTVERTFLDDGGDMVHVVLFRAERGDYPPGPHQTAYYFADELKSAEVGTATTKPSVREQD